MTNDKLKLKIQKNLYILGLVIFSIFFFLSRFAFISESLLFFDSPQYAQRLTNPNLWQVLVSGHPPLHSGYILIFWPWSQMAKLININPILLIKVTMAFVGWLGFLALFDLLKKIFDEKAALKSILLVAFLPILWLINLDLLVENAYWPLFMFGLWFSWKALEIDKIKYALLTTLFLSLTFLAHPVSLIYWPGAFLFLILSPKAKGGFKKLFFSWLFALFLAQVVLFVFYVVGREMGIREVLYWLFLGKLNEHVEIFPLWLGLARIIRNFVVLTFSSFTVIFTITGIWGLFKVFKAQKNGRILLFERNKVKSRTIIAKTSRLLPRQNSGFARRINLSLALTIWFLPSILAAQWWDGLLQGRHLLLSAIPLAIAISVSFKKSYPVILVNLLVAGLGAVLLTRPPTPQEMVNKALASLPQNGIYLESHFWRPWTTYPETVFVNEPFWPKEKIGGIIEEAFGNNRPVFVSSQALSEPYGLYSGPVLHPLTLSFRNPPSLKWIGQDYKLTALATASAKKHLTIYKIERGQGEVGFKNDSAGKWSSERMDFGDPVSQVFLFIYKSIY